MSIVVRFHPSNMTRQQYESVNDALNAAGAWPPAGCLVHVCFGDDGDLRVSEIWESREQFEAFGVALRPEVEAAGIQMTAEPEVFEAIRVDVFQAP